ncbi:hypothetical protein SAMD00019534_104430 [Acytostelium subglobosum LB1]|uniref:hypothetical protein n=1 Tax=Acytostelium subglobosum LB1 TaxID=1410327 RepID=UPI000644B23F|nr:hypothetical protein SAMD00019534_104430 [Acytostelium subglobosum LB1]GAM27268.1 hypothetical protein SAMD00019534_104430 [Acytostelium subglobosum LB1]|eukprot:XP_012749735.1 hypothetical protein SAMD00019534_104430 [Acytostelium subglobosum LB1]
MAASPEYIVFQWASIVFLVALSGLFAGLTLGIMSLDITGLEIVIASGSPKESKYAKRIYPVRQRGNLLLCTLLLGNVSVNSLLAILMADITDSGLMGFMMSTVIILLVGEIIPQATCARHALAIGAHTIWIVYIFICIFFPFSYPISKALDLILGSEMGTIYSRQQLKKLLDIHSAHSLESGVSRSDATLLSGVLDFASKTVSDIMTSIDNVTMLDIETKLDIQVLTSILENGHSRMPVYEGDRTNIVGCLHIRDLVILNPEENVPLRTVLGMFHRQLLKTWHDTPLEQMLNEFKTGKSHMAIVHKVNNTGDGDPYYENIGIVCLEDVLEEILQDDIFDEADDYRTIGSFQSQRRSTATTGRLTSQQVKAIYSFLNGCMPEFSSKLISENAFSNMLAGKGTDVVDYERPKKGDTFVYRRGVHDEFFTIVLQGKLEIRSGNEGFQSECGPFSTLGLNALNTDQFIPDFAARVQSETCQLLRISKTAYDIAIKATTDEYNAHVFRKNMIGNEDDDLESSSINLNNSNGRINNKRHQQHMLRTSNNKTNNNSMSKSMSMSSSGSNNRFLTGSGKNIKTSNNNINGVHIPPPIVSPSEQQHLSNGVTSSATVIDSSSDDDDNDNRPFLRY